MRLRAPTWFEFYEEYVRLLINSIKLINIKRKFMYHKKCTRSDFYRAKTSSGFHQYTDYYSSPFRTMKELKKRNKYMQTYYKITSQNNTTCNGYEWISGEWRKTSGKGALCGDGWLHFYHSPDLAVLLNPIYADIVNPILWEAEMERKIAFGIYCVKEINNNPDVGASI